MRDVKMTSSQLMAAKKQLIGQIGVASDNNENNALGMAKTFLHYNKYESSESVFRRIEALTAEGLLEVANEMFAEEYLSTLFTDKKKRKRVHLRIDITIRHTINTYINLYDALSDLGIYKLKKHPGAGCI